jgi:hypothetical protein
MQIPIPANFFSLSRKIPYAPEDQTMYFIDISRQDMEMLGTKHLNYLNNCYEDNTPYVWLEQPSHIASVDMPMPYMRLRLLKSMREECQHRYNEMEHTAIQSEFAARTLLYSGTPAPSVISRCDKVYAVSRDFFGTRHWFCLRLFSGEIPPAHERLHEMIRKNWVESRQTFRKQLDWQKFLLSKLNIAIEAVEAEISRL